MDRIDRNGTLGHEEVLEEIEIHLNLRVRVRVRDKARARLTLGER